MRRSREDIEKEAEKASFPHYGSRILLEVILDIRESLEDIKRKT